MIRAVLPWLVVAAVLAYGWGLIETQTFAAAGGSMIFGTCVGVLCGAADVNNRTRKA